MKPSTQDVLCVNPLWTDEPVRQFDLDKECLNRRSLSVATIQLASLVFELKGSGEILPFVISRKCYDKVMGAFWDRTHCAVHNP